MLWDNKYEIGIDNLDVQHFMLFNMLDLLIDLSKNNCLLDKYDKIIDTLSALKDYAENHFSEEEAYMLSIGYSGYEEQVREHRLFRDKIEKLDLNKIDDNQEKAIRDLVNLVYEWLTDHILRKDKLIPSSK